MLCVNLVNVVFVNELCLIELINNLYFCDQVEWIFLSKYKKSMVLYCSDMSSNKMCDFVVMLDCDYGSIVILIRVLC